MTKWSELKLHDGSGECPVDGGLKVATIYFYYGTPEIMRVGDDGSKASDVDWERVLAYRVEVRPVVFHLNVNSHSTTNEDGNIEVGHCFVKGWDNLNLIKTGDEYTVEVVKPTEGE